MVAHVSYRKNKQTEIGLLYVRTGVVASHLEVPISMLCEAFVFLIRASEEEVVATSVKLFHRKFTINAQPTEIMNNPGEREKLNVEQQWELKGSCTHVLENLPGLSQHFSRLVLRVGTQTAASGAPKYQEQNNSRQKQKQGVTTKWACWN